MSSDVDTIHKGSLSDSSLTTYPMGASLSDIMFSFVWDNRLSAMYADWGPPHLSLAMCYIFHLLISLLCKTWLYKHCNRNCKKSVLDVIRTLGTSSQAIYYILLNIYFSSLVDLNTLIIMSPKIDAPCRLCVRSQQGYITFVICEKLQNDRLAMK